MDGTTLSQADSVASAQGATTRWQGPALGETIDRYQLRRLLGEGGMGRVYLGRDLTLGRAVAIKFVRLDREAALFTNEARAIASLNHPHIVQIYDVGEHRGMAYLALEHVEGESLKDRLRRERPSLDEGLRMGRAIASALVHAHAAGVHHCDLKPSNIMLGRDGRLRVVDFGLARTEATRSPAISGTPDWMAPEQWLGHPSRDRVDIWALAIVTCQILIGRHPFPDVADRREWITSGDLTPALDGLPEPLRELASASLRRDPAARPEAAAWHRVFDELVEGRGAAAIEEGPYRGLASFGEHHARFYFGREEEIDAFIERLRTSTVLPIIGPSGAGKSSFVFAGVIPRLRARGEWTVLAVRPGNDPFAALASQLAGNNVELRARVAEELRETPTLMAVRLQALATTSNTHVVLVVDQLEELFTMAERFEDIDRFLRLVVTSADDPLEPIRVVFTLRDDFVGRVAGLDTVFVLKRLYREQLRATIVGPLERLGYRFDDDGLVGDMIAELGDGGGELPLLQFACRALWEARDPSRRLLLRATYREIGGVGGALARHADGLLAELLPNEQRIARHILLSLVVHNSRTQVEYTKLATSPGAASVLDKLIGARLVVPRTAAGEQTFVEIVHESLLRAWDRFARWLDESRDERRLLQQLEEAADFWERRGARREESWGTDELVAARHQITNLKVSVPERVEAFLQAGELRQQALRRRARTRLAILATIGGAITVVSLLVANEFRRQKLAAEEQDIEHERALANIGKFDLILKPFEWVDGAPKPVDASRLPALSWRLYEPHRLDEHRAGSPYRDDQVVVERKASHGERIDRIEVRGGPAFLRIDGRSSDGNTCGPSWVRLRSLPGYIDRQGPLQTIELAVPTCQATLADTVVIPAGQFVYGGAGDPPTRFANYVEPEQIVPLADYRIDRTEVSNARFAPFASLERITGYEVPHYPNDASLVDSAKPDRPLAAVDAYEAEAFCRYMGKRLPSDFEWTKAARGGLVLDGAPNPAPRRLFPWGRERKDGCANLDGDVDGYPWVAPVDAATCDRSPYGVVALGGNVAEWISRVGQSDRETLSLRVVRGGQADSPRDFEHATTVFRNSREARKFLLTMGVRCVVPPRDDADSWDR